MEEEAPSYTEVEKEKSSVIAVRIGIAIFCGYMALSVPGYDYSFLNWNLFWRDAGTAGFVGGVAWAISYIVVYAFLTILAPFYLAWLAASKAPKPPQNPPGAAKRPLPIPEAQNPPERSQARLEPSDGMKLANGGVVLFQNGIAQDHVLRLANMICVDRAEVISGRRLEQHGVINRLSTTPPTAQQIITWLRSRQLVTPMENNQYKVTDLLRNTLSAYLPSPTSPFEGENEGGGQENRRHRWIGGSPTLRHSEGIIHAD